MAKVRVSPTIELEFERSGDPLRPTIVLIMGLGMQLTTWPDELVDALVVRGYSVLRFDNRDAGLSTQIDAFRPRGLGGALLRAAVGLPVDTPYRLSDLADDTVGLLDALGLQRVHVVGASMGGMVAQLVAARHPQRVLSLTSIMSTSGARWLPPPRPAALRALMRRPPAGASVDTLVDHYVKLFGVIGSPDHPTPEPHLRERLHRSLSRAFRPAGTARQLLAIVASGDRCADLALITAPTLVIHGAADPLVPAAAGRDTARRIRGAELLMVPGMGHDLPLSLLPMLAQRIAAHCDAAAGITGSGAAD